MDSDELNRFCQKQGVSVSQRNIDNSNIQKRLDEDRKIYTGPTESALKIAQEAAAAKSVKMSREEAALRMKRAQSAYALREYSRLICAKEMLAKKPDEPDKLPKREMMDQVFDGASHIIMP